MSSPGTLLFAKGDQDCDDIWDDTELIQAYDRAINSAKDELRHRQKASSVSGSASDSNTSVAPEACSSVDTSDQTQNRRKRTARPKWCVGSYCCSVYSADGRYYEAEIESIDQQAGTCVVQFVGYCNTEDVSVDQLQPSKGAKARRRQIQDCAQSTARDNVDKAEYVEPSVITKGSSNRQSGSASKHRSQDRARGFANYSFPQPPPYPSMSAPGGNSFSVPPLGQVPPMLIPPPIPFISDDNEEGEDEALASMLMAWYMSGYHTGYYQGLKSARSKSNCKCRYRDDSNSRRNCR